MDSRTAALRRYAQLVLKHGLAAGRECSACKRLLVVEKASGKRILKCRLAGVGATAATDWKDWFPACGAFVPLHEPLPKPDPDPSGRLF